MTVQCHDAVEEVGVWLTGEFSGRVPATTVADVVRATRRDLEGRIATEELGEMLHRMARAAAANAQCGRPDPAFPLTGFSFRSGFGVPPKRSRRRLWRAV